MRILRCSTVFASRVTRLETYLERSTVEQKPAKPVAARVSAVLPRLKPAKSVPPSWITGHSIGDSGWRYSPRPRHSILPASTRAFNLTVALLMLILFLNSDSIFRATSEVLNIPCDHSRYSMVYVWVAVLYVRPSQLYVFGFSISSIPSWLGGMRITQHIAEMKRV